MLGAISPPIELKISLIVMLPSYDLELDKKLAEETTVLVESYTVRSSNSFQ